MTSHVEIDCQRLMLQRCWHDSIVEATTQRWQAAADRMEFCHLVTNIKSSDGCSRSKQPGGSFQAALPCTPLRGATRHRSQHRWTKIYRRSGGQKQTHPSIPSRPSRHLKAVWLHTECLQVMSAEYMDSYVATAPSAKTWSCLRCWKGS